MSEQLQRDLSASLRAVAAHAPDRGGWGAIHDRIALRQRARHRRRAVAGVVMVVALTGGVASMVGRDGRHQIVAGPPAAPASHRFVVDLPGFTVVHADEVPDGSPVAGTGIALTVLARPDAGLSGPALFVQTVPAEVNFGLGERSPASRVVDVGGLTGHLAQLTSLTRSLGWRLADGSAVRLIGVRMTDAELLAAAAAQAGGGSWPLGLVPIRTTSGMEPTSPLMAETRYEGPRGEMLELRVQAGGQHVVDTYVADRVSAAGQVSRLEIDGVEAVLSTYEQGGDRSLIWAIRPGLMAELDGTGLAEAQLLAAARSIRPAGPDEWAKALGVLPRPQSSESMANDAAIADLGRARCVVRDEWLAARASGDPGGEAAAQRKLADLIARYRSQGVQPNGDIFLVVDRLLAAMNSGDAAAVSAQPCN